MFILNIFYYLFSAGIRIGFFFAFLLWQFYKKIMGQQNIVEKVVGTEKIFVSNDVLLEMFQFCNFRMVGTNFCLVNLRWSQLGQWHCQNRLHRIPKLILSIEEKEKKGRQWFSGKWEKNTFLRSWHPQNASEEKLASVPANIPKNYEKIQMLLIEFPYDWNWNWNHGWVNFDWRLTDFISACSGHMDSCRIDIRWNGVKSAYSSCQTSFDNMFLASICQLREIHFVFEEDNQLFHQLKLCLIKWLLGKNIERKDEKTTRKLKLTNIYSWEVDLYLESAKNEFYKKKEKMFTFDVLFLLLEKHNGRIFVEKSIKNTKTGQIFYTKCGQIDGRRWVMMGLCNSMEELDKPHDFNKTEKMPIIQWNMRPGNYYIEMKEKEERRQSK